MTKNKKKKQNNKTKNTKPKKNPTRQNLTPHTSNRPVHITVTLSGFLCSGI